MALDLTYLPATADRPQRVLLVEDSETDVELLCYLLRALWPAGQDLKMDCVADVDSALTALRQNAFALLLIDWRLPGLDADHLLKELPTLAPCLPVVVITGLARSEIPVNLAEIGAVFLHKDNLNRTSLADAINTAISHPSNAGREFEQAMNAG